MFQCVSEWRIQYSERRSRPAEPADVEITSEALTLPVVRERLKCEPGRFFKARKWPSLSWLILLRIQFQ